MKWVLVVYATLCFPALVFAQGFEKEFKNYVFEPCLRLEARLSGAVDKYGAEKGFQLVKKHRSKKYMQDYHSSILAKISRTDSVDMREAVYEYIRAICETTVKKLYNKLKPPKQISMRRFNAEVRKYVLNTCYYEIALGEGYLKRMSLEKAIKHAEKEDKGRANSVYDSVHKGLQRESVRNHGIKLRRSTYRLYRELCRKSAKQTWESSGSLR